MHGSFGTFTMLFLKHCNQSVFTSFAVFFCFAEESVLVRVKSIIPGILENGVEKKLHFLKLYSYDKTFLKNSWWP
jgi:hypothetical protein